MAVPDSDPKPGKFLSANLRDFLHDFAAFAGRDGVTAAILVAFGAVLEGLSMLLLVPLLGIVIGSGMPSGYAACVACSACFMSQARSDSWRCCWRSSAS